MIPILHKTRPTDRLTNYTSSLNQNGVTLTELMIALAILGTVIMVGLKAFDSIQKSIQYSKARTLGTNLAQEKMQILKQQSYNRLMVSTNTAYRTDFTPNIPYDAGYYAPENILEGGIRFTRLTYVQVAQEDSGNITTLPDTTPDTGMKLVTTTVIWSQETANQKVQVRAIDSNSDTVMAISILQGLVRNAATLQPIQNAVVNVAENVGWRDTTNASGNYLINMSPGNFTLMVSADGYFTRMISFSIAPNQTLNQPTINLTAMSSGTVRGSAWINDHIVISQVVGSTVNASTGFDQEYVELFNPSTFTWTVASNATTPLIDLIYNRNGSGQIIIGCTYNTLSIPAGGYYLYANTTTITAVGTTRVADAVFTAANVGYPNLIKINTDPGNDAASAGIAYTGGGAWIDRVGWKTSGNNPPFYEGAPLNKVTGLELDEQFVRRSSTSGVISGVGRAYDGNDNNTDFMQDGRQPMIYPPRNSSNIESIVSGVPAVGAIVTATDGLSQPTTAYSAGSVPYAEFLVPGVATGTWTVFVTSSTRFLEILSVTVTANTTTYAPNGSTSPTWPLSNYPVSVLSSNATMGFVSGRVTNALGVVISPAATISALGGGSTTAGVNGYFLLGLTPGNYTLTANPSDVNATYVSQNQTVAVVLGEVTSGANFTLSQGGRITGRITRDGTNGLSGIAVAASNSSGITVDQEVSGSNGSYTLVNLATGTYTVEPVLDAGETSNPTSLSVVVAAGTTVTASTLTITGAYGTVSGSVAKSGSAIKTGVLIVVSTTTISGSPPALSSSTLTGAPYYSASSLEDGTYSVGVRGSSTTVYRVHAFYSTLNGSTPVLSSAAVAGVSITAGVTTSGVNFAW